MKPLRLFITLKRLIASVVLAAYLPACTSWKTQPVSPEHTIATKQPSRVRVTRADGSKIILIRPQVAGDSLAGDLPGSGRPGQPNSRLAVPLSDVREVAVERVDGVKTGALIVGLGLTAVLVAAALSEDDSPPPCQGEGCHVSCPLVYSWSDGHWRLDSGTFGGAVIPALARTDVDNLDYGATEDGILRLKVANELSETDHIDALSVLAVDHEPGVTVAPDGDGRLYSLGRLTQPTHAVDFRGRDGLARVRDADGWSWESNPFSRDTASAADTRDGLELVFPKVGDHSEARLVLDGHNTPWAAYLIQELIGAHGRATQAWYDSLAGQPALARRFGQLIADEAFLSVSVWSAGRWQEQGHYWEAGPEIVKRQVMVLDLSGVDGDSVRVRLESAPSFWLIDHVALDYTALQPITVREFHPNRGVDHTGRDVRTLIEAADRRYLTLETGDAAELTFRVPQIPSGSARTYLVRSTGWYRVHTAEVGEPDVALLSRLTTEPGAISRVATGRLNDALLAMERMSR